MLDLPVLNFLVGAGGALVKLLMESDGFIVPSIKDGKLFFGGFAGVIIGGVTGILSNNNPLSAFLGGFAGTSLITTLVTSGTANQPTPQPTVKEQITTIAKQNGIDPDICIRVATCESSLKPKAVNVNQGGSIDRGLFQINNLAHPEVTAAQAFDITFSCQFFCTAFKGGNLAWWNSSRKCWDIPVA